jgi:hypothetical protein
MNKLLFVLLALTVMAMPALASVQNISVSGDIETTYLNRQNFDLGYVSSVYRQSVILTQTRLRVDADLTDKVSATIALINERVWGADNTEASSDSDIDLNLAYVTMKEMLYSPLTVKLGRQNFAFGNSFVIDSAGTNNSAPGDSGIASVAADLTKQTAQDALRLTFDYDPLTIDVLYSSIDQGTVNGTIKSDNIDLYGVNLNYQFNDEKASMTEAYFWVKDNKTTNDRIYMPGVRGSMNVLDGWNLQAEVAMQMGNTSAYGAQKERRAYAAQILSNYLLPFEKTEQYQPVLGFAYTMYSGDKDPKKGDVTAWDPMYENQAGGKIYNTLFNATNSHTVGASLTMVPVQDVTANLYYDLLWLDKKMDDYGIRQPDGNVAEPVQNANKSKLGQEVGMVLTYDYTEDVQFGARAGWFFPGSNFDSNSNTASQLLLNAKVAF